MDVLSLTNLSSLVRNVPTIHAQSTTLSSSIITYKRLHYPSHLQIINRSFYQSAPVLWNALLKQLLDNSGHLGTL
jgi:hypothetical protein